MRTINDEKYIKIEAGSVVTPKGFSAVGVHAGLRKIRKDIGVIYCEVKASCAAVYTLNSFQAAPIIVTKDSIEKEATLQVIVVNSACANACTGAQGEKDAYEMRALTAEVLGIAEHDVAVSSTGVIGEYLPMDKVREGIKSVVPTKKKEDADAFCEAILTTDLVAKTTCYQGIVDGSVVSVAGAAKGSGMIHPNMATMLAFVTTDANIESNVLQRALNSITNVTFNQITVDGETSTNDTVVVMASKLAEHDMLTENHPDWDVFYSMLEKACQDLAKSIAKDGEGATKLVEVQVKGANSSTDAGIVAKKIVGSDLVKTAMYGEDGNWGRIICAIGHSDVLINPNSVTIGIGDTVILQNSEKTDYSEELLSVYLKKDEITIYVDLGMGSGEGTAWGCDLSYDYVKINACYRT